MSRLIHSAAMAGVGAAAMTVSRGRTGLSAFEGCEARGAAPTGQRLGSMQTRLTCEAQSGDRRCGMRPRSGRMPVRQPLRRLVGRAGPGLCCQSLGTGILYVLPRLRQARALKGGYLLSRLSAPRLRQAVISFETLADLV